jgi:hypothetical protein
MLPWPLRSLPQVWHLPNDPNTRTTRQLADFVLQQAGQPRTWAPGIKPWIVRTAALTNRTMRELPEMQYQFEEPFIVESSKITNTVGVHATPVEQALADTLATYRTATSGTHPKSSRRVAVETMMAIVHTDYSTAPEDVLRLEEVDKPTMADGDGGVFPSPREVIALEPQQRGTRVPQVVEPSWAPRLLQISEPQVLLRTVGRCPALHAAPVDAASAPASNADAALAA